jgi:hypothetical protein
MATQREDYSSVNIAEMTYLRQVKDCTRPDCFRNENMRKKLNVILVTENIDSYSNLRGEHLLRMVD